VFCPYYLYFVRVVKESIGISVVLALHARCYVYTILSTAVLNDRRHMDQVAERLAELRERRALTLRELSDMSGVAADTINQIELGHRKARPSTLRKLARALEIDVQEFYAEPALPKAEAPREAGQLDHDHAAMLLQALENARKVSQPLIEQDDQTIAAYRQALERMKGGIGVSDAYFVEESPELAEVSPEQAEVVDLALEREQRRRKIARSR
jgi:transcriptional regulator with XRE-family HTH domain